MRTVYLHVGLHKTGTSSIQKFFYENNVICFNPERLFKWDRLKVSYSNISNSYECDVLFSYEQFSWMDGSTAQEMISDLREAFDKIVVILFTRDQQKLAVSHKNQSVKSLARGARLEREVYGLEYGSGDFGSPQYLDYSAHKNKWSTADELVVFDFDKLKADGAILQKMLEAMKCDYKNDFVLPYINSSLPYDRYLIQTHIFRACNDDIVIERCLNNLDGLNYRLASKVAEEEEVVVNPGLLALMDLFYHYLSDSVVLTEDRKQVLKELLEYLSSENKALFEKVNSIFDCV